MPSQVAPNLYVGDIDDARNGDTSYFDVVVTVCQDGCEDNVSDDTVYEQFNLSDGPHDSYGRGEFTYELFSEAVDMVLKHRIHRNCVLVHCHAGVSRSPTVAISALAVLEGFTWDEAFESVKSRRQNINPNESLISFGKRYIDEHQ